MHIDTEIRPVIVEIGDKEYPVAPKTVDIAEKLHKAEDAAIKSKKLAYEMWREHLEILLGRTAVKEIFPGGKAENLDRMEAIYTGVMDAFNFNGREQREARTDAAVAEAKAVSDALKPLSDLFTLMGKAQPNEKVVGYPTIKRPE